ncbi:MAG: MATE family efflux transporter [Acidaminococcaceae bacterium]|nr:MATE family efflux transporter [Acidaminococcaceae bacterium]
MAQHNPDHQTDTLNQTLIADFTTGNVNRQLVAFAMPMFLSHLLQIVYNMADMIIVGQTLGKVGLSAISVGGDIMNCMTFIAMGFSSAGQVLIAQYIGSKQHDKLSRFVATMGTTLFTFAICVSAIGLTFRKEIMELMHTPPEAFEEALAYAGVSMAGIVFIYGYNAVSAILRGMGDAKHPFYFISFAAVLNILLDLLFVVKMGTGAKGAALATIISQGVSFLLCAAFMMKNRQRYYLSLNSWQFFHPHRGMLLSLLRLGVPMAIKNAAVQFSKMFVNSWINSFGVAVSAFAGIANKINMSVNMVSNSFNTAGASMVGQNIGAEKYDRVRQIIYSVYRIMLCVAVAASVIIYFFPAQVYGIFTDDPSVIQIGYEYIPIAILAFLSCAGRSGSNALINGCGNSRVNFITAILDGIVLRLGLSVLFGLVLDMKYLGFWMGDALANFTPLWVGMLFYHSGAWKKRVV